MQVSSEINSASVLEWETAVCFLQIQLRGTKVFGPTSESYSDKDAVQETFIQQRGFSENKQGATGDVRDLQKSGVLEAPLSGPKEVSKTGDSTGAGSSFYDNED